MSLVLSSTMVHACRKKLASRELKKGRSIQDDNVFLHPDSTCLFPLPYAPLDDDTAWHIEAGTCLVPCTLISIAGRTSPGLVAVIICQRRVGRVLDASRSADPSW